jgi:hypothetical protein
MVSKTRQCVIVVALGTVCGCAGSPYGKQWNNVLVTDDQKVVASCKYSDDFHSWPLTFYPMTTLRTSPREWRKPVPTRCS